MNAVHQVIDTPDGPFALLVDDEQRVLASGWTSRLDDLVRRLDARRVPSRIDAGDTAAAEAVRAYYAGDVAAIDTVPVRQHGTDFQLRGWAALRAIPAGRVLTYAQFATALDRPSAVRAAAAICAANAPALFTPCHRVRRSDGTLGGFAWGPEVKQRLLDREAALTPAIPAG